LLILKSTLGYLPLSIFGFNDPNYLIVELHLECMLEWALQNDISLLENASTICWNKNNQNIWMFFFCLIQKFLIIVYTPTI
jgi:hypothetical protein